MYKQASKQASQSEELYNNLTFVCLTFTGKHPLKTPSTLTNPRYQPKGKQWEAGYCKLKESLTTADLQA
jgi:hypothetical protein